MKTQSQKTTKILLTIAAALTALAALCVFVPNMRQSSTAHATESEVLDPYLHSPTTLATNGTIFVSYDDGVGAQKQITGGVVTQIKNGQKPDQTKVFESILISTKNNQIWAQNAQDLSQIAIKTKNNEDFSFNFSVLSFDVYQNQSGTFLIALADSTNNLTLHIYKLTTNQEEAKITLSHPTDSSQPAETYTYHTFGFTEEDLPSKALQIAARGKDNGFEVFCATQSEIYKIDSTSNTISSISFVGAKQLATLQNGSLAVLTQDEQPKVYVYDNSLSQTHLFGNGNYTAIATAQNALYAQSQKNCSIAELLPQEELVFENDKTLPQLASQPQDVLYATTNKATVLKNFPYSLSGTEVEKGTQVVVLATQNSKTLGCAYVSFVNENQNQYGFIPSKDLNMLEAQQKNHSIRAFSQTIATALPSPIIDNLNAQSFIVAQNEEVTVTSDAAGITNGGKRFVVVKNKDNKVGYVELSHFGNVSAKATKAKINSTNATINGDALLFKDESTKDVQMVLTNGTRVKTNGKVDPNKEFTYVTYEASDGTIFTGYVQTRYLVPDGLTTLQIIGIVLLVINSLVLALVTAYAIYVRKRTTNIKQ